MIRHQNGVAFKKHPYKTFYEFVKLLLKDKNKELGGKWMLTNWHFSPQVNYVKLKNNNHPNIRYIDIKELSPILIKLYNFNKKGNVTVKNPNITEKVYNTNINDFDKQMMPNYHLFYNRHIANMVTEIYKEDLEFAKSKGFNYKPPKC